MPYKDIENKRMRDKQYRLTPEVRARKRINSFNYRLRLLGLDSSDYKEMLVSQDYSCKICGRETSDRKGSPSLCVDHCHKTNNIRGLLCAKCNKGLGLFLDNPAFLRAAADYLENQNKGEKSSVDHSVL